MCKALFDIEDTAMELKRISLKENSVGAGVFGERTIEIVLEKIRDACILGVEGKGEEVLKKLFSDSENPQRIRFISRLEEQKIQEEADAIIMKDANKKF